MTFAIAAAGTGGHVYPGLAVAEALEDEGVAASDILFLGGNRMEKTVVPEAGYPFLELELRGLSRSLTLRNLGIPMVVRRATRAAQDRLEAMGVRALLGMGGYVTVPAGLAARRAGVPVVLHEQNAHAGLANRFVARWARRVFVSFPTTSHLDGEVVGNPLRRAFAAFDGDRLRPEALARYEFSPEVPVVGVFGGSLGAGAINEAVTRMASGWDGGSVQIVHLVGSIHQESLSTEGDRPAVRRRIVGFEERMDLFYAASDLVVARAGGSLFEVAATGTPMVVVPGSFGGGHQAENARAMEEAGAAVVVPEQDLAGLGSAVQRLLDDAAQRATMAAAARAAARPDAARVVARAMMELAG